MEPESLIFYSFGESSMPKVSVIIPIYNAEQYISETIRSVLDQTFQDFELLAVDDGSPDKSVEVCQQFTDPRIKIIRQANRGLSGARNTGIRHAEGEYIAFLDADDIWRPQKLEKHVEHLESRPLVGISFSYSAFINEFGALTGLCQKPKKLKDITPSYILCRNPVGNGSAAMIRRAVFEQIKYPNDIHGVEDYYYFDENFRQAEDVDFWMRVAVTTNWQLEGIPEVLTLYRINSGGLSANALQQLEGLEKVIQKTQSYAPEVIAQYGHTARAYYLRYTARRAVTLRDGAMAVKMLHRALASDWRIFLEEPGRTLMTSVAAYLLWLLPYPLYNRLETLMLKGIRAKHTIASPVPSQIDSVESTQSVAS
jgi:glycosyltransferase involved in cell wall biosynthesis